MFSIFWKFPIDKILPQSFYHLDVIYIGDHMAFEEIVKSADRVDSGVIYAVIFFYDWPKTKRRDIQSIFP